MLNITPTKSRSGNSSVLATELHGPGSASPATLDAVFSALSSPTRRAILVRLSKGECSVTDLARPFDMSLPAISKHLRVLEQARLITIIRSGRNHLCRLAPAPLKNAEKWITYYRLLWEGQLDSLAEFLKSAGETA